MEYLIIIIGVIFSGLLIMIQNSLSKLPDRLHDMKMEDMKTRNAAYLQVDSFYRKTSNDRLRETLESWIEVIYDIDKFSKRKPEHFIEMLSNVVLYGSDKSLIRMADFQQYIYKMDSGDIKDCDRVEQGIIAMYLASFVITQLKKDFTGYTIDFEQLLRSKLKDYDIDEERIFKCKSEAFKYSTDKDDFNN